MKDYTTVFDLVARDFAKAGIRHVLIGGFAVNFYNVSRGTSDADFLLATDDLKKASDIAVRAGYREIHKTTSFALFRSKDLRAVNLDFILVDRETLDGILKEARQANLGGNKFYVPSLNHLIALKLHAMKNNPKRRGFRDLQDILDLVKQNKVDVTGDTFRSLCLLYGTQEAYDEILRHGGMGT